ncbi:MAG: protease modulator HflC [Candidatus Latescibacteria bacterium]|nr:protease modulator HflC [Candidatus Latescibacterota bacterium]
MKWSNLATAGVAVLLLLVLSASTYTVDETEQVIILQFGKPVGEPITEAGLHFKMPLIQDVITFDKRIHEWDGDENQIPTSDKKYIWVDTFARWRIVSPLKFYQSVNNERNAQSRLDDIIDSATRNYVSENLLIEVVRNSNRELQITIEEAEGFGLENTTDLQIEQGREKITELILAKAAETMPQYGIELLDMRIKRMNYIEEVRQKVYERMISERKRIAEKFRSEGQGRKAEIDGEREKEMQRITSEAYRTAQEIKGKADAEATRIYASAFNRDPEFYSFIQTLETYKSTLDKKNTTMILSTDSDFLKYLKKVR